MKALRFAPDLIGIGILTSILFSGCAAPYRVQTSMSPSLDTCKYKTYSLMTPEDQTRTQWLSDPKHRQALDNLLREPLKAHGLTEVPAGSPADLWIRQRLESSLNSATQTTEGVVMASDYKLAKWRVELAEGKDSPAVWSLQLGAVIGDIEKQNLKHAHDGLRSAFSDYPSCQAKKSY